MSESSVSPATSNAEGWGMGPEGERDVFLYINEHPLLLSMLYDINLMPEQHPDPESKERWMIFNIVNHWRENDLQHASARSAPKEMTDADAWELAAPDSQAYKEGWNACRKAMLASVPSETPHSCVTPGAVLHDGCCPKCGERIIPPLIAFTPSATPCGGWIPVGEKSPEKYSTVLMTDGLDRSTGFLGQSWKWDYAPKRTSPPTHWAYIQEAPDV